MQAWQVNDRLRQALELVQGMIHGCWQAGSMENNYVTSLPRRTIRPLDPVDGVLFFLERAVITPTLSLQQKVFPNAEY